MKHKNVDISKQIISMDKKYETRDGKPVRVLCVDRENGRPVVALAGIDIWTYKSDGSSHNLSEKSPYDLIEIKEEKPLWVIVWIDPNDEIRSSVYNYEKDYKIKLSMLTVTVGCEILATKKITYTEGERIDG